MDNSSYRYRYLEIPLIKIQNGIDNTVNYTNLESEQYGQERKSFVNFFTKANALPPKSFISCRKWGPNDPEQIHSDSNNWNYIKMPLIKSNGIKSNINATSQSIQIGFGNSINSQIVNGAYSNFWNSIIPGASELFKNFKLDMSFQTQKLLNIIPFQIENSVDAFAIFLIKSEVFLAICQSSKHILIKIMDFSDLVQFFQYGKFIFNLNMQQIHSNIYTYTKINYSNSFLNPEKIFIQFSIQYTEQPNQSESMRVSYFTLTNNNIFPWVAFNAFGHSSQIYYDKDYNIKTDNTSTEIILPQQTIFELGNTGKSYAGYYVSDTYTPTSSDISIGPNNQSYIDPKFKIYGTSYSPTEMNSIFTVSNETNPNIYIPQVIYDNYLVNLDTDDINSLSDDNKTFYRYFNVTAYMPEISMNTDIDTSITIESEIELNQDILNPIEIQIREDVEQDLLNPIEIQIREDVEQDLLNPITISIPRPITPVDPFEISITVLDWLKSITEIEDYINKTYLGSQQAADDFQLLFRVTDTSYWPVEYTIDTDYHIHIKPDPMYIGVELYACTNKQFLYCKYDMMNI